MSNPSGDRGSAHPTQPSGHASPQPPYPPQPDQAGPKTPWWRSWWFVGPVALVLGLILGSAGGGDAEPAAEGATTPTTAAAAPAGATPGTCLQAIDLARAGQTDSREFEVAAGDCRAKAAGAPTADTQPVEAAEAAPEQTPVPETTTAPQPVAVPDLVHFTYADAIGILKEAGVPAEAIEQVPLGEDSIALNPFNWIVLEHTPAAGETWQPDDVVRLGIVKRGDPKAEGIQPRLE